MPYIMKTMLLSMFVKQQARGYVATQKPGDLSELKTLIEAGKLMPVIDRTYELEEIGKAFAHLDQGHASGKVVIKI